MNAGTYSGSFSRPWSGMCLGRPTKVKGACSLSSDFVVLDVPPTPDLNIIVNSDANGLYSLRLIATISPFMAS